VVTERADLSRPLLPHIRVAGGPRERGFSYGRQAKERVRRSVRSYRTVFQSLAGMDWHDVRREAQRYRRPIVAVWPEYFAEIEGIAEGGGLDVLDVLAINVRTEIMFTAKARQLGKLRRRPSECTALSVLPRLSASGHTLLAQNWDWLPHCSATVVVLEADQADGPNFVTVVEAGLLAKCGMNAFGLGVVTNALVTDGDVGSPGLPYHVLLRAILDASTASDALSALMAGPRSSSANYLIAHADGIAIDVEAAPGDFSDLHLTYPAGGLVSHTNHFTTGRQRQTDLSLLVMPDSLLRLQRIVGAVSSVPNVDIEDLGRAFSDHANYPLSVCAHPDERLPEHDRGMTIASVVMDLATREMWLADGNPCSTPYRRMPYGDFLQATVTGHPPA
jgi:isopenicillin-N N-acyltransferase-like protein